MDSQFNPVIGGTEGQVRQLATCLAGRSLTVEGVTQPVPGSPPTERLDGVAVARAVQAGPLFGIGCGATLAGALHGRGIG